MFFLIIIFLNAKNLQKTILFSETLCFYQYQFKNAISLQTMLYFDAIAITRYAFIFKKKNPALFQDDFWSFYINLCVISFSFLSQSVHAFLPGDAAIKFFHTKFHSHIFYITDTVTFLMWLSLIWVTLDQGCTTQISWRAKKMLLTNLRARLVKFFFFFTQYLHQKLSQMYVN